MFMNAQDYRLKNLINQNNFVEKAIEEASHNSSPIIRFPFAFYPEVVADLQKAGWDVISIRGESGIVSQQVICPIGFLDDDGTPVDDIPEDIL